MSTTLAIDMSNAEPNIIDPLLDTLPPPPFQLQRGTTTIFHVNDPLDVAPPPPTLQRANSISPVPSMKRYFTDPIVDVPWTQPEPNRSVGYAKRPYSLRHSRVGQVPCQDKPRSSGYVPSRGR